MNNKVQSFYKNLDIQQHQICFDMLVSSNISEEVNEPKTETLNAKTLLNMEVADIELLNNEHNSYFNVKQVNLSCGLIKVPNVILHLKYLSVLNLSNNSLENIPKEIGDLCNLKIIKLSCNKLNSLPKSVKDLQQLIYLDLSSNEFSEIPEVLYYGVRALKVLDISCNKIVSFNDPPACLNKLVALGISNNFLKELPFWMFDNLCQLQFLYADGNQLQLDVEIVNLCGTGAFESLQLLNIKNCSLSYENLQILPFFRNLRTLEIGNTKYLHEGRKFRNYMGDFKMDVFKNLKKIKYLNFQNAQLASLPLDIDCLKNIEVLDFSDNFLSWLPESFCNLVSLKILNLTSNQLLFLPENIGNLTNLQQIHLGHNKLYQIPESFYNLRNLEFIDLYDNQIEKINLNIIKEMNLKGIDLELNCLNLEVCFEAEDIESYNDMKDSFRRHFHCKDSRGDFQKPKLEGGYEEKSSDLYSNSTRCSISSIDNEFSDDEGTFLNLTQSSGYADENWEEESTNDYEEEEVFDPNEMSKFKKSCNLWSSNLRNNYCPANCHKSSVMKTYMRNYKLASQNIRGVEDGQFDSD